MILGEAYTGCRDKEVPTLNPQTSSSSKEGLLPETSENKEEF